MAERQTEYQRLRGFVKSSTDADSYSGRLVRLAIEEELTEKQRRAVMMYYYRQMTMRDIARELGLNPSTVSRTLKSAREKLRRCMKYAGRPFSDRD